MKLKRPVTVKAIVTDELKTRLREELNKALAQIETASQQLDFQLKKYVPEVAKADLDQAGRLRREIETERQRQEQARTEIQGRMTELNSLEIGAFIVQGQIEGEVEISVGDDLVAKMSTAEIVVKDGIIQEITEG